MHAHKHMCTVHTTQMHTHEDTHAPHKHGDPNTQNVHKTVIRINRETGQHHGRASACLPKWSRAHEAKPVTLFDGKYSTRCRDYFENQVHRVQLCVNRMFLRLCAHWVRACVRACECVPGPVSGALLLQVNSVSVCLSRPEELRLSAESKCYSLWGSMRKHSDLSCKWPHLTLLHAQTSS